jgi:predicted nuclease of predicted toxin-antitoxin system
MRFLADENFPARLVAGLSRSGHDVAWVPATAPGLPDLDVLSWATRDERTLLTFDKDFGELACKFAPPTSCGIILFRVPSPRAESDISRLVAIIDGRQDWSGHFAVIEPARIRMRRLGA